MPPLLTRLSEALYTIAQYAGTSGDWGPLEVNDDIRTRFRRHAATLIVSAGEDLAERLIAAVRR